MATRTHTLSRSEPPMNQLQPFTIFTGGLILAVVDYVQQLNVLLGLLGTILMLIGGIYSVLSKHEEWKAQRAKRKGKK